MIIKQNNKYDIKKTNTIHPVWHAACVPSAIMSKATARVVLLVNDKAVRQIAGNTFAENVT